MWLLKFQPTHPHGVRLLTTSSRPLQQSFNPRTRTGCDFEESRDAITLLSFNPRTRTGCDELRGLVNQHDVVSTHAPARGATFLCFKDIMPGVVSTHAPARGATFLLQQLHGNGNVSTHTPARGATISRILFLLSR